MLKNFHTTQNLPTLSPLLNTPYTSTDLYSTKSKNRIRQTLPSDCRPIKASLKDAPSLTKSPKKISGVCASKTASRSSSSKSKKHTAKSDPLDSIAEAKLAFIKSIFETKLIQITSLHFLKDPKRCIDTQLQAIDLMPDELCRHQTVRKDDLRLAIVNNSHLPFKDRFQALYRLESDANQTEALKIFNQDEPLLKALLLDIKVEKFQQKGLCPTLESVKQQKKLSKNLLNFYFFNKTSGDNASFDTLIKTAFLLDKDQTDCYPGCMIRVSDSDAALISLALNSSFSLKDRFRALRPILSVEAKLHLSELKAFLETHASSLPISLNHNLSKFELISPREFSSNLALLLLPTSQEVMDLYKLIQAYHIIPKRVKDQFVNRTELLGKVIVKMQKMLEALSERQDPTLAWLQSFQMRSLANINSQAQYKTYYLKKLPGLKQKALDQVSLSLNPKYALAQEIPVLNVVNDILRNLDPLKREGLYDSRKLWKKIIKEEPKTPNFWLWLDTMGTDAEQDPRYSLWSKEQKRVQFKEGVAYNATFGNKDNDNRLQGDYIYAIGQDGQLYIMPYFHQGLELSHDTILKGKNILSAGVVTFEQGKLTYIDVSSGHYAPDRFKNLQSALVYFSEKNPGAIAPETRVGDYETYHANYLYEDFKAMQAPEGKTQRQRVTLMQLGFKSKKPSSLT